MTTKAPLDLRVPVLLCCMSALAAAAQEPPSRIQPASPATSTQDTQPDTVELILMGDPAAAPAAGDNGAGNRNALRPMPDKPQWMLDMQRRLQDPAQRPALRSEQRDSLRSLHPDIAAALRLHSATADRLIELLADRQMEQLDEHYSRNMSSRNRGGNPQKSLADTLQERADTETRSLTALSELLGEDGLERYQTYSSTLLERGEVNRFDAGLPQDRKLLPEQKERLIARSFELNERERQQSAVSRSYGAFPARMSSDDFARYAARDALEMNQETFRRKQASDRLLLQTAEQILDAGQLAALAQMNAETLRLHRESIEAMRLKAGLDREIPDAAEPWPEAPARKRVSGNVKFELSVAVNGGSSTSTTHVRPNGEAVEIEAGNGLMVKATPTLFEDDWLHVDVHYYQQGRDGQRRLLQSTDSFGSLIRRPDGTASTGLGSMVVVAGAKAYALTMQASAERL